MNDLDDINQTQPGADANAGAQESVTSAGFCQNCGKPLTAETIRKVGPAVYCEPCLAARLEGRAGGYRPVNSGPAYGTDAWMTQRLASPGPNPGLAALLGLIPGVGAMYNEQYAKGIIHLLVFAVLVSLSDNVSGIFGLFVAGWVFYMAIEAHHTARARRDGTPLPNPFGLNDIGERLGFGRTWPTGPSVADVASDAAAAAAAAAASFQSRPSAAAYAPPSAAYAQPFVQQTYEQAYRDAGVGAVPPGAPPAMPFTPVAPYAPIAPMPPYDAASLSPLRPSRFPAGAVWLIGLGVVFLLSTTRIFNGFEPEALIGCILLGLGVWIFLRRMMETGNGLQYDGSASYPLRLVRALRFSVYLDLVGTLFLLDGFHLLTWHYSWPLLIILPGVMAIAERFAYQSMAQPYPTPPAAAPADPAQGGN